MTYKTRLTNLVLENNIQQVIQMVECQEKRKGKRVSGTSADQADLRLARDTGNSQE